MLFWMSSFLCALAQPSSSASDAVVVDRAVAIVGEAVITLSDIRMHRAMAEHDPSFVPVLQSNSGSGLQEVVDATIVRQSAGRIPVYQPTPDQIDIRMDRFMDQWPSLNAYRIFLATHGLTEDRIRVLLRRRAIVERVVLRALGTPKEDITGWTSRFQAWMETERRSARIRLIQPQGAQ